MEMASPEASDQASVLDSPISEQQEQLSSSEEVITEAFESAETSVEEKLSAVKELESAAEDDDVVVKGTVGKSYLQIAKQLYDEGGDREKVIEYCRKALTNLEQCCVDDDDESLKFPLVTTLHLLGCAFNELDRGVVSLGYLERAETVLCKMEEEKGESGVNEDKGVVKHLMLEVQRALVKAKCHLMRDTDSIENLGKVVEILESLGEDSKTVTDANYDLAKQCVSSMKFEEALPSCLKALEVHKLLCGSKSVEVVRDRMLLWVSYTVLEEKEKAAEQNQLIGEVLRDQGVTSDLCKAVTSSTHFCAQIGKGSEAFEMLKGVVSLTDGNTMDRATVYIAMAQALGTLVMFTAKALGDQKKRAGTIKRYLKKACRILGKQEGSSPLEVSRAYDDISMVYQDIKDFESAISLTKKGMVLLEKFPEEKKYLGILTIRMGLLLRSVGENESCISFYEATLEILKETFGEMNGQLTSVYCNMGVAYQILGRTESAAQCYSMAQDILDATLGPNNTLSIMNRESLSRAYSAMGNYVLAIKMEEKNVEGWKALCPRRQWEYHHAQCTLKQLKNKSLLEAAMKGVPPSYN